MAKQQQKKKRPTWFQKQVDKGGKDFLLRKGPMDIQRDALNIVRDIMRNNITENDFQYLFDLKVLSNVRLAIYAKFIETQVYDSSMSYVLQNQYGVQTLEQSYQVTPDNFQQVMNTNKNLLFAYSAILYGLDSMIAFVSNPDERIKTREAYFNVYSSVQAQLSRFRYNI